MLSGYLRSAWDTLSSFYDPQPQAYVEPPQALPVAVRADPNDLSRLPFHPASTVIANVFRNLSKADPKSNMALEARVGATIWLLTYVDANYSKTYAESMYPQTTFANVEKACRLAPPRDTGSNEFFHWLCMLGQKALTGSEMGFDGRVIVGEIGGSRVPQWQSVAEAQKNYKLNFVDDEARLMQAQGYEKLSDKWILKNYPAFDDPDAFINDLKVGNIKFHLHKVLNWADKWSELEDQLYLNMHAKQYQEVYDLLITLDKVIPLSTWQLDKPENMGNVMTDIWHKRGAYASSRFSLNGKFFSYCQMYLECCLELGKNAEAERMFNNSKVLVPDNDSLHFGEDKACAMLHLCKYAKRLDKKEDNLALMKQAAQYFLHSHALTSAKSSFLMPAYLVAKLWQQGEIKLEGTLYSKPLSEAFDIALKAHIDVAYVTDDDSDDEYEQDTSIFSDVSIDDKHQVIKKALNALRFEADHANTHPARKLTRTTSCSALFFKPEKSEGLMEITAGSAYEPVRLAR